MKILLISVENTLVCFGVRMISAVLKREGYDVQILFIPKEFDQLESERELMDISEWVVEKKPDLIGFSLMSSHWRRAVSIHEAIRKICKAPVIWGGIHPTLAPEECLDYADMVCIGEGEKPMSALVKAMSAGESFMSIPGIWVRTAKGEIIRNPPADREDNLSDLPFRIMIQIRIPSSTPSGCRLYPKRFGALISPASWIPITLCPAEDALTTAPIAVIQRCVSWRVVPIYDVDPPSILSTK